MLLVSSGNDIKFHSASNFELLQTYRPSNYGLIRSLCWCRDGTLLSTIPFKGNAEIIRTKDDIKLIQSINNICAPSAITFQKTTKKHVALGSSTGTVLVYDIKARTTKKVFEKSGSNVVMLEWNYKDTHLASLNSDGEVFIFSNLTNQKTGQVSRQNSKIATIRFNQKGLLGFGTDDGYVGVWDNNVGRNKFFAQTHKAPVTDIVFSLTNPSLLTSAGLDRSFMCYDTSSGQIVLSQLTEQPLSAIDMSSNGHDIAVATIRGLIYVYDLRQSHIPIQIIQAHDCEITRVFYQPQETQETIQIPEDKTHEMNPNVKEISVDSFLNMECFNQATTPTFEVTDRKSALNNFSDSFMNDLSPARHASCEFSNLGITEGVKKWIDSKNSNIMDSSVPVSPVEKTPVTASSSTPQLNHHLYSISEHDNFNSPIPSVENIPENRDHNNVNDSELRKIVKDVVTEVVTEQINDLTVSLSRYFLNLQMSFSKQFVNQEYAIQKLLVVQPNTSNLAAQNELLKEENEFLKKKLNDFWKHGNSK